LVNSEPLAVDVDVEPKVVAVSTSLNWIVFEFTRVEYTFYSRITLARLSSVLKGA
jgi:hypothetical protein